MMQSRRNISAFAIICSLALVAAGCGGAPEAPAGDVGGNAPTGAGTGAPGGADPLVNGAPGGTATPDGAAPNTGGVVARVPDVSAESLQGKGLSGSGGGLFDALAVDPSSIQSQEQTPLPTTPTTDMPTTPSTPVPSVVFSGAKIYVDGMTYDVNKGDSFPEDNPLFKLTSVTASAIELELVAGEFTDGGGTGTVLDKGDLVGLLNASEAKTYKVKFVRAIEGASAAPSFQ